MAYQNITDPPKTVKEAIDWLLRIGRKDDSYAERTNNSQGFCDSVKALLGGGAEIQKGTLDELCKELGELVGWTKKENDTIERTGEIKGSSKGIGKPNQNGSGYQSAYGYDDGDYVDKRWMTCGARKGALELMNQYQDTNHKIQCCNDLSGKNEGCQQCMPNKDCPTGGCCPKCPEAACARIFCLIIPVLHSVLRFLHKKLESNVDGWQEKITEGAVCTFFKACGFDKNSLNKDKKVSDIKDQLGTVVEKLQDIEKNIFDVLKKGNNGNYFLKASDQQPEPQKCQNPPASLTEMLLWLQFLPYSTNYKEVLDKAKGLGVDGDIMQELTQLYSQLPLLFFSVEGKGGMQSTIFDKIGQLVKCEHIFKYDNNDECAKTLLGIICTLYPCLRYLNLMCDKTNGSWRDAQLNGNGKDGRNKDRLKNYLGYMGFSDNMTNGEFKDLKGKDIHERFLNGDDKLYKHLEEAYKEVQKYFKDQSNGGNTPPTTVREMMLWLIGLPYCKGFDGLKEHIKLLCGRLGGNGTEEEIETMLLMCAPTGMCVMNVIEKGAKWSVDSSKGLHSFFEECYLGKDDSKYLTYEDDKSALFKQFVDYCYKVTVQLRFLYSQCKESKNNGGWKDCDYGNGGCNCNNGSGPLKTSCLKKFLEGESTEIKTLQENKGQNGNNKFYGLVTTNSSNKVNDVGMGFQGKLNGVNGKNGNDIFEVLQHMVDRFLNSPLCVLTMYLLSIGQCEPESLGDCFDVFTLMRKDGIMWRQISHRGNGMGDALQAELETVKQNGEGGQLQGLIEGLFPGHWNGEDTQRTHEESKNDDLYTLMCYNYQKPNGGTCAPYMWPISFGLYVGYVPACLKGAQAQGEFKILQWLYDVCYKLLRGLQHLKSEFDKCSCCSAKDCGKSIVECKMAHPMLYRAGFTFVSAPALINHNKKCDNFKTQLRKVIATEAPLYNVFKKITGIVYCILLKKATKCVTSKADGLKNGLFKDSNEDKEQWEKAFTKYVTNAMQQSKNKFDCTFLCKLFNGNTDCNTHKDTENSQAKDIVVKKGSVTSITPIIPKYSAPHIDQYHYRTFQKKSDTETGTSTSYDFKSAIDFHIKGAQCISPSPVALRSVIDWMLRVTVGNTDGKSNIERLSEEVLRVFQESGVTGNDDVNDHIVSLVECVRTFMGYRDKSGEVKKKVGEVLGTNDTNGIKKTLKDKIDAIDKYLKQKKSFGTELGRALLKGRYDVNKIGAARHVIGLLTSVVDTLTGYNGPENYVTFKDAVKTFTDILRSPHPENHCKDLKCTSFDSKIGSARTVGTALLPEGLNDLSDLFDALRQFAEKWNTIGNTNGERILQNQKNTAMNLIKYNGQSPQTNGQYFTKLYEALHALGECHSKVKELDKNGNGYKDSKEYRTKINELITGLQVFSNALNGSNSNIADPQYAVNGAQKLIEETKRRVEAIITISIKDEIRDAIRSGGKKGMSINNMLEDITKAIASELKTYQSHLDDLKALCQWLYRMGQLYNAGLKGFVESLIKHLEHIVEAIGWMEIIKLNSDHLNGMTFASHSELNNHITPVYNLIPKILSSYVLHELPNGSNEQQKDKQKVDKRIQLLTELRLLALDRYTLQVWEDECSSEQCKIKNWITFENGIVRQSDLGDIKEKLSDLTNITPFDGRQRVHQFHAICVIQKFSYEAPITRLEKSLEKLKEIQGQLGAVKDKCDKQTDVRSDETAIKPFCKRVDAFLSEPYGIFQFGEFVHTILGPNIFSAVVGALEELTTDKLSGLKGENGSEQIKATNFYKSVVGLLKGPEKELEKGTMEEYKLESIISRLTDFIATLKKEYIFSYPVVACTEKKQAVAAPQSQTPVSASYHSATDIILKTLDGIKPPCPSSFHTDNFICERCYPHLANIFIACLPLLYPQLGFLCYQGQHFWSQHLTKDDTKPLCSLLGTYGWQKECMEKHAYIDVPFCGHHVSWLLNKESGSLKLLDPIVPDTLKYHRSPLNKESPLRKLYDLCIQYYQRNAEVARQKRLEAYRQKLADKLRKNAQSTELKNVTLPLRRPSTLREILRWMSHLQFWCNLHELEDRLKQRCMQSGVVYGSQLWNVLLATSVMSAIFSELIEQPGEEYLEFFSDIYTNTDDYIFISSMDEMLYMFSELLVELYRGLKFMCLQCSLDSSKGGWRNCHVTAAATAAMTGAVTPKTHFCTCPQRRQTQSDGAAAAQNCQRPLQAYLTDDLLCDQDSLGDCVCKTMPHRGWKQALKERNTPGNKRGSGSTAITGDMIFQFLKNFVGHGADAKPLLSLTRFMITISIRPPDSMTGYFSFLYQFGRVFLTVASMDARQKSLEAGNPNRKPWSKKTYWHNVKEIFDKEIDLCPGIYNPKDMSDALMALVDYNKGHDKVARQPARQTSEEHKIGDLSAISFCPVLWRNQGRYMQCGGFILPLEMSLYGLWSPRYCRQYLSWVLHFGPKLYTDMENMRKEFEKHTSEMSLITSHNFTTCTFVLPSLHKSGFHLYSPKFQTKDKECADFVKALDKVLHGQLECVSALCRLLRAIEQFLWSIRLPFSLVQLSLWSVTVLFISYVLVVPLDHFKIKSHLFNRLQYTMHPSLLVSDGQRRVSEVAYFSL